MVRRVVQRLPGDDRVGALWEPVDEHGELDSEVRSHLLRGRAVTLVPDRVGVRRRWAAAVAVLLVPFVALAVVVGLGAGVLVHVVAGLLVLPGLAVGGVLALAARRDGSESPRPVRTRPIDLAPEEERLRQRSAQAVARVLDPAEGVAEYLRDTLPDVLRALDGLAPRLVRGSRLRLAIDSLTPSPTRDDLVHDLATAHRQSADVVEALVRYADHVEELTVQVRALRDAERAVELRDELDELTAAGAGAEHAAGWLRQDGEGLTARVGALTEIRRLLHEDVRRLTS